MSEDETVIVEELEVNPYYHKDIIAYICKHYMSLICLWSGLMLGDLTRHEKEEPQSESDEKDPYKKKANQVSRDNNAYVENWMRIVKVSTLLGKKGSRLGFFVRKIHTVLKGRLEEFLKDSQYKPPSRKEKTKVEAEAAERAEEKWKSPKQKGSSKKPFFYSPPRRMPTPRGATKTQGKPSQTSNARAKEKWTRQPFHGIGLENNGNMCWMNSTIQALAAMHKLNFKSKIPTIVVHFQSYT